MVIDPPAKLPVGNLSVSSLTQLWKCPEKWRRRYIENEWEPTSPAAVAGRATGAAAGTNYQQKIETKVDLPEADVLDNFSDEFDYQVEQSEIDWDGAKPGPVKDKAAHTLATYHRIVTPKIEPVAVERKFSVRWDGLDWAFQGYLDLEESDGAVSDLKLRGRKLDTAMAAIEPQPTAYLLARSYEQAPAPQFNYHVLQNTKEPLAYIIPTKRTEAQLDAFVHRIFAGAAEIHWRMENDTWSGAVPGSWWCGPKWCGFWNSCPHGGLS